MTKNIEKEDILIVDDNLENLKVLSDFLRPVGYRIRIAKNGVQALNRVKSKPPKLILLDIQMPEMGGYETCRRLKQDSETMDIPVIFVSALSTTFDKVKAFESGAVDYIEKPFHLEEVIARVNTHLTVRRQRQKLKDALGKVRSAQNQLIQSEKMVSLGVLSAGVAHEINNPINFVSAGASGVELDLTDLMKVLAVYDGIDIKKCFPDAAKTLTDLKEKIDYDYIKENIMITVKDIKMGAERTAEIIKSLKHFSRMDSDEKYEVDIYEEIRSNVKILERLTKKEIDFQLDFHDDTYLIMGFPGQLNQLFMNLIMNAEQAIEEQGQIKISTKAVKDGIEISVSDTGCGIPKEMGDRVFEPFLTSKEVGEGTGLGLSISFGIVTNHKGSITYKSKVGKGTVFTIFLPQNE